MCRFDWILFFSLKPLGPLNRLAPLAINRPKILTARSRAARWRARRAAPPAAAARPFRSCRCIPREEKGIPAATERESVCVCVKSSFTLLLLLLTPRMANPPAPTHAYMYGMKNARSRHHSIRMIHTHTHTHAMHTHLLPSRRLLQQAMDQVLGQIACVCRMVEGRHRSGYLADACAHPHPHPHSYTRDTRTRRDCESVESIDQSIDRRYRPCLACILIGSACKHACMHTRHDACMHTRHAARPYEAAAHIPLPPVMSTAGAAASISRPPLAA